MHPRFLSSSLLAFGLFFPALVLTYLLHALQPSVDAASLLRLWLVAVLAFAGRESLRA